MKINELFIKKFENSKINISFVELLSNSCLTKYPKILLSEPYQAQNFTIKTGKKMTNFTFLRSRVALLFLTVASFCGYNSHAQQEAMFSQYMFNTLLVNPAYAGSRDVLSITALGRQQWFGVDGAPQTYTLSVDMPLRNEKMGIGFTAFSDRLGTQNNMGGYLTYAYRIRVGARSTLSFGVQGGVDNLRWALNDTKNINALDPAFAISLNKVLPNIGGGLYLSNDRGYIGLSVPRIMQNTLFSNSDTTAKQFRHYYAMMGLVFGKGAFKIKPSMLVRYTKGAPLGLDGNINFWIKDKIAFGVSGRSAQLRGFGGTNPLDAVVGMLEVQLTPQLRLGYAYDMTLNKLNDGRKIKNGLGFQTHEGMLRYEFGFGKNKILTPRYF